MFTNGINETAFNLVKGSDAGCYPRCPVASRGPSG